MTCCGPALYGCCNSWEVCEMAKEYSSEALALRERVVTGNQKLNLAWAEICKMDHTSQEWKDALERWHQANERLSTLCSQLKMLGYEDCLYIDGKGKMGHLGHYILVEILKKYIYLSKAKNFDNLRFSMH